MAVDIIITSDLLDGESECVVSNWYAGNGDTVKSGTLLVEVMVSKIVYEITAPADGVLRIKAETDEVVTPGTVIGTIE